MQEVLIKAVCYIGIIFIVIAVIMIIVVMTLESTCN